jgi:hypothetical protein
MRTKGRSTALLTLLVIAATACVGDGIPGRSGTAAAPAGRDGGSESDRPQSLTVPVGAVVVVEFVDALSSETTQAGETFRTRVVSPLTVDGRTAIPAGAVISGTVTEVNPANRFGGKASLDLAFDRIELPSGVDRPISAVFYTEQRGEKKRDGLAIGVGAAGGAIIGRVLNEDDRAEGTRDGAIVGAVIGTVIAAATKGGEVAIPAGSEAQIRLDTPLVL